MTEEELREIEARCEAATPGPWTLEEYAQRREGDTFIVVAGVDPPYGGAFVCGFSNHNPVPNCVADGRFIAHSHADVPALVAEVRRLRALIGSPPEGSHPDEWQPRDATWHEERATWRVEVDRLRALVEQQRRDCARLREEMERRNALHADLMARHALVDQARCDWRGLVTRLRYLIESESPQDGWDGGRERVDTAAALLADWNAAEDEQP